MADQGLLTLIEERSPEDLTLDEIEALSAGVRSSDEVRSALACRLRFEDGMHATLGEPLLSVEQIVQAATAATPTVTAASTEAAVESAAGTAAAGTAVSLSPVTGWGIALAIAALSLLLPVAGYLAIKHERPVRKTEEIQGIPVVPAAPQVPHSGENGDGSAPLAPPVDLPPGLAPSDEDVSPSDFVPPGFDY